MARLAFVKDHPRRALSALATLLLAVGLTVGSGAFFEDTETSQNNSIEAGTLSIELFGSGSPVVDANDCREASDAACNNSSYGSSSGGLETAFRITNMVPGAPEIERRVKVTNNGTVPAHLRLSAVTTGSQALIDDVQVRITRLPGGGNPTFSNVLADVVGLGGLDGIDLEPADNENNGPNRIPLEPGETYEYVISLSVPESGSDQGDIEGESLTTNLVFRARDINSD